MKTENILHLIAAGERRTVEYKRAWNELPGNLFETVCAFLNRDGGSIILGVEDNGSIERGVNPETMNQMCGNISNISNNPQRLFPPFLLNPEVSDVNGKKLIIVEVPSSSQVHRFGGKVYDRSNDGDYELRTDAEISALYQRKSTQYSENNIYPFLRLEDLRQETIEKARNLIRGVRPMHPWLELSTMDLFRQANLYRRDLTTGQEGFTLAALMLFGKTEIIQSALPYYKIDAVLKINDIDRYDDRLTLFGNIIDSYEELMKFIEKHLPDPFYLDGSQRISLREKIFREIIVNMLVHREYLNPIPTNLEISTMGVVAKNANRPLKAGPVTLANSSSHPKNPHVANFFVQMGWAEHLGTGIRNLYKYVPQYTGRDPLIDDEDVYKVEIGLPLALQQKIEQRNIQKNIQRDIQKKLESLSLRLTQEQMSVAAIIGSDSSVTRVEIGEQLGLSDASVNACIIALKKKGVLVRIGGKRYGEWGLVISPTTNENDKITKV